MSGRLANAATSNGIAAPAVKLPADANAACSGRARDRAENPSSSRACAASASCAISCSATCAASAARKSAAHVDVGQFAMLAGRIHFELGALLGERRGFAVGLRMHGDVFADGHRHGARDERRRCRSDRMFGVARMRRGDAEDQRLEIDTMPSFAPSTLARSHDSAVQLVPLMTASCIAVPDAHNQSIQQFARCSYGRLTTSEVFHRGDSGDARPTKVL